MAYDRYADFADLKGKTFVKVVQEGDSILFHVEDGSLYYLEHQQDCCESVFIESVVGDLDDLAGEEILIAEDVYSDEPPLGEDEPESYTWTFYKLATRKGYVDIRFYGESNGYYGESADLYFREAV